MRQWFVGDEPAHEWHYFSYQDGDISAIFNSARYVPWYTHSLGGWSSIHWISIVG